MSFHEAYLFIASFEFVLLREENLLNLYILVSHFLCLFEHGFDIYFIEFDSKFEFLEYLFQWELYYEATIIMDKDKRIINTFLFINKLVSEEVKFKFFEFGRHMLSEVEIKLLITSSIYKINLVFIV